MINSYHVKTQKLSLCFGTQKKEVMQPALYYFVSNAKLFVNFKSNWKQLLEKYHYTVP